MGAVFISYRRGETAGEARALFNDLVVRLGKDFVFMDVDNIALGRDFRQVLYENLASCELMLVLIGKNWVDAKSESGRRRLEDPGDFIRIEIGAALKRNIPVTPVFVQGARMPAVEQLPEDIRDLHYRNGFELSHNRWDSDVQEMIKRLGLSKQQGVAAPRWIGLPVAELGAKTPSANSLQRWFAVAAALVVMIAVAGGGLLYYMKTPKRDFSASHESSTSQQPPQAPVRVTGDGLPGSRGLGGQPTSEVPSPLAGRNDRSDTAKLIAVGATIRGSTVTGQDEYFFKFTASSAKTRIILRKRSAGGFQAAVDVYDHDEQRVAGVNEGGGVALVVVPGSQDRPVTFPVPSAPGEIYYIKVKIFLEPKANAEYELTVRDE